MKWLLIDNVDYSIVKLNEKNLEIGLSYVHLLPFTS